jgi:carboxypeptidase Taq
MQEKLQTLREIVGEITDLSYASGLLGWDQQTYMPPAGAAGRGYQFATLARLIHQRSTAAETGRLLEDLNARIDELDPASDDAALIRFSVHEYQKQTRVPEKLVMETAQVTASAHEAWVNARQASDFSIFQPLLERVMDLRREYAQCFAPYDHIYDPLLDDYERGMKTSEVQSIFNELRPQQVALIKAISERPQVDTSFFEHDYPEQQQWDFGVEVITGFGYDWKRGRQDKAAHPFTISISLDDVRITTRFDTRRPGTALFGTMHEAGHALYELGVDPALMRTPLANGASLALHESQSRMWENLVGRSLPFWKHFYPRLQSMFPSQLSNVDLLTFYKGINKVAPSFIRVEADEATYNLHIMLRLELEIALMEGSLQVKDLPEAWNERMRDYLGVTPPNDAVGVLQDIHWSGGMIGYFPTYALGNLVSAQLWERINSDIPDLAEQIERGEFASLLGWLRDKIHRHGAKFEPQALVEQVTGSKIDPKPYIRYLQGKYTEIYGL